MDVMMMAPEGKALLKQLKEQSGEQDPWSEDDDNIGAFVGCTATVILITKTHIFCANSGDSRTVLARSQGCLPLSEDHKPDNEIEKARIEAAGGFVAENRVNGNLALSRALGDF